MIFAKHNFTSNFLNAVGLKDEFMADQILIDEVARLIVDDKKNVVEALRKSNVNATYRDNNDFIKALLVKEIETGNKDILRFLSERIIATQLNDQEFKEIAALTLSNAITTSSSPTKPKSKFVENIGKVLQNENVKEATSNLISQGIQKIFSTSNPDKTSNDQQLSERLKVNEMKSVSEKKTSNKKIIIIFSVIIGAGLIALLVFLLVKRKYEKGGMLKGKTVVSDLQTTYSPETNLVNE
jgi:hypothetical protein